MSVQEPQSPTRDGLLEEEPPVFSPRNRIVLVSPISGTSSNVDNEAEQQTDKKNRRDRFHVAHYNPKIHDPEGWNHGQMPRWTFDPSPTFKPSYIADLVVLPKLKTVHNSPGFVVIVTFLLFAGFGVKLFAYNWAWPPGWKDFVTTTSERGNALYVVSIFLSLIASCLVLTAMNRQLLKKLFTTFDFLFYSMNLVLLGVYNCYDEYQTQTATISVGVLWMSPLFVYALGAPVVFGGDAITSTHGGRRLRAALAIFGICWVVSEMILWRWFRDTRNDVFQLPFFQATVGSLACTNAANHMLVLGKVVVDVCTKENSIALLGLPVTYTDLEGVELTEEEIEMKKKKEEKEEEEKKKKKKETEKEKKEPVQPYPITWRLDSFQFRRRWLADVVVVNNGLLTKFHMTKAFGIVAIMPMFAAVGLQLFAYDWDYPEAFSWVRNTSDDQIRGTALYVTAWVTFAVSNLLLNSAFNRQMLFREVGVSINTVVLFLGMTILICADNYDVMVSQSHVIVPWTAWCSIPTVLFSSISMFAGDAASPRRIGKNLRIFFFFVAGMYMVMETFWFRWFRETRDEVIELPFYRATLGGLIASVAFNLAVYMVKLCLQSLLASGSSSIFLIKGKLDLIRADPEVEENAYQERVEKWSPTNLTLKASHAYTAQQDDEATVLEGEEVCIEGPGHELGWYYISQTGCPVRRAEQQQQKLLEERSEVPEEERESTTEPAPTTRSVWQSPTDSPEKRRTSYTSPVAPKRIGKSNVCWVEEDAKAAAATKKDDAGNDKEMSVKQGEPLQPKEPTEEGEEQDGLEYDGEGSVRQKGDLEKLSVRYLMLPLAFVVPPEGKEAQHRALATPARLGKEM